MTSFEFGKATDVGVVRQVNQDRFFVDGSLFAVADGMGGHSGGEVASGLAVEALTSRDPVTSLDDLVTLVHSANQTIVEAALEDPSLRGMGTTISVLADLDEIDGEKRLGIANVGDSRVYRVRADGLSQLTEDHSLVEALVRDGRLSPEEAGRHPQRNILTRALGIDTKVLVDAWEIRAVTGDRFVICSDGLFNELSADEIAGIVGGSDDPQATADSLVARACDAGGRDNVTAVVVHVTDGDEGGDDDDRVVVVRLAVPDAETYEAGDAGDPDHPASTDESRGYASDSSPTGPPSATRRRPSRGLMILAAAVIIVVVLIVTAVAAYARSAYYVGVEGPEVVIYQGRPGGVLWFEPTVEEPVNVGLAELEPADLDVVSAGVEFAELDDARDYGRRLALRVRDRG